MINLNLMSRKLILFVLSLASIVILSLVQGSNCTAFPYIIGLYTAYCAGNVGTKLSHNRSGGEYEPRSEANGISSDCR